MQSKTDLHLSTCNNHNKGTLPESRFPETTPYSWCLDTSSRTAPKSSPRYILSRSYRKLTAQVCHGRLNFIVLRLKLKLLFCVTI